jgi:hypothetical protein
LTEIAAVVSGGGSKIHAIEAFGDPTAPNCPNLKYLTLQNPAISQ